MATNIQPAADTQTDRKSIQFESNRFESIKNKSRTDCVAKGCLLRAMQIMITVKCCRRHQVDWGYGL